MVASRSGSVVPAPRDEVEDRLLPEPVGLARSSASSIGCQQVGLEHVHRAQRLAAVVHRLEDRVRVGVGVGGISISPTLREQPVDECGEPVAEFGRQVGRPRCRVAGEDRLDRLLLAVRGERLAVEQRLDDGSPFRDVEVELLLAVVVGVDQRLDRRRDRQASLHGGAVQVDQQQRQRCDPLLPVDQVLLAAAGGDDDRAEEVVAVLARPCASRRPAGRRSRTCLAGR